MPDEDKSKGIWKLATQLANKVTRKQAAIILILIILVYGSSTFVTTLAPSLSNTPNLLVVLAVVVICVSGYVAIRALDAVSVRNGNAPKRRVKGRTYSCQVPNCAGTFQATPPDSNHNLADVDRSRTLFHEPIGVRLDMITLCTGTIITMSKPPNDLLHPKLSALPNKDVTEPKAEILYGCILP